MTLKMGSKSPKANQFLSMSQQYSYASLVKFHPFFPEIGCRQPFSNNLSPRVTLKMESRSPKSNQFFCMSQQSSCASLVKIHPFLQETGCRQAIFQQSRHFYILVAQMSNYDDFLHFRKLFEKIEVFAHPGPGDLFRSFHTCAQISSK